LFGFASSAPVSADDAIPVEAMISAIEGNLKAGRLDRAEALLNEAQRQYPENAHLDYDKGLFFAQKEQPDLAIASFQRALKRQPTLHEAYLNLALEQDLTKKYDEASATYAEGTKHFPGDADLFSEWGTNLILRKHYPDAERVLRRALVLKSGDRLVTADLAFSILKQNRAKEAVALYEQAMAGPGNPLEDFQPEVRRQYGDALAATGELKKAEQIYSGLLAKDPRNVSILYRREKVREALGDKAGAAKDRAQLAMLRAAPTGEEAGDQ
jgi:tetratricopeptide (TPR) repeat protein